MRDNRERKRTNWGSLIGWLIFILIIGGRPIFNLLQNLVGGPGALPPNLIPILLGALVLLSVIVSAVRALGSATRSRGDSRLPNEASTPRLPPSTPMPPFGGAARGPQAAPPSPRGFTLPSSSRTTPIPQTPRFDPVINPAIFVIGILGLLVLGGVALIVLVSSIP